jgi:two-component system sensor histidine kinase FlrB
MFEPFFSTKKGGTGLGLALVRKIVIGNKGRILAGNGKSGGAEIALDIPLAGQD